MFDGQWKDGKVLKSWACIHSDHREPVFFTDEEARAAAERGLFVPGQSPAQ